MSACATDEVLHTPEEWLMILRPGWLILDPDGWRLKDAPAWDEPITAQEFGWRFALCTICGPERHSEEETTLWRCTTCGKWSHAKRRPRHHMRTVVLEPSSQCYPLCDNCAPFGGCGGASDPVVEEVRCGPFERWTAQKVDGVTA